MSILFLSLFFILSVNFYVLIFILISSTFLSFLFIFLCQILLLVLGSSFPIYVCGFYSIFYLLYYTSSLLLSCSFFFDLFLIL